MPTGFIPKGYGAVTPWIISRGPDRLFDFMKRAFGAEELFRLADENGRIGHAEAKIGDSVVMTFDAKEDWPETPSFLSLVSEDGDAAANGHIEGNAIP